MRSSLKSAASHPAHRRASSSRALPQRIRPNAGLRCFGADREGVGKAVAVGVTSGIGQSGSPSAARPRWTVRSGASGLSYSSTRLLAESAMNTFRKHRPPTHPGRIQTAGGNPRHVRRVGREAAQWRRPGRPRCRWSMECRTSAPGCSRHRSRRPLPLCRGTPSGGSGARLRPPLLASWLVKSAAEHPIRIGVVSHRCVVFSKRSRSVGDVKIAGASTATWPPP